jgi:hypothetical protein
VTMPLFHLGMLAALSVFAVSFVCWEIRLRR